MTNSTSGDESRILSLLQQGNLPEASRLAGRLLQAHPQDAGICYLFGLTRLLDNDNAEARKWLQQAVDRQPDNRIWLCNLGLACSRLDDNTAAIDYLNRALDQDPDYLQARYNLGCALLADKQAQAALEQFQFLKKKDAGNAEYICCLGDARREMGNWTLARKLYEQALDIDASLARAHANLGPLLLNEGKIDAAMNHCRRAIELEPEQANSYKNLGDCLVSLEQLDEAMDAYADAYELKPDSVELCTAIGKVWVETNDFAEAGNWYNRALLLDENYIPARCGLAGIMSQNGNAEGALEILRPMLDEEPDNIELLEALGDICWENGDADEAIEHLRHAKKLQPQRAALLARIARILSSAGDVDEAEAEYMSALDQNPFCVPALNGLATTLKGKLEPQLAGRMEKMISEGKPGVPALASLHNGLAFYYDGRKDFEASAEHTIKANDYQWEQRQKRHLDYNPEQYEKHIDTLIASFTPDYFDHVRGMGSADQSPVFIVAMPRSGTTLTEQILARHSRVLGIGERNFAAQSFGTLGCEDDTEQMQSILMGLEAAQIQAMADEYLRVLNYHIDKTGAEHIIRVVDKMPDNYSLLGWIATLFPKAKIIHANRDARDVALSCWMTQFGAIRWASKPEHITHRIQQYWRIMDHWRKVLPTPIYESSYERLVAEQETESRKLVDFIGLDWEPECLEFYNSDRLVRTASITQVRQPIYKKSVAKWMNYAPYVPTLFNPIGGV